MEAFRDTGEEEISSLCKVVKLLSNLQLLPLSVNYKTSEVKFSFLSPKTIVFGLVTLLPSLLSIMMILLQIDYYKDIIQSIYEIFSKVDAWSMIIIPGVYLYPGFIIHFGVTISSIWTTVPELSMEKSIMFPSKMKNLYMTLILSFFRNENNMLL